MAKRPDEPEGKNKKEAGVKVLRAAKSGGSDLVRVRNITVHENLTSLP
jgi:hypothetical protein